MGEIFNLNNKFFQICSKVVDCFWLSFLWVIFCIPVFSVGAATSALYYTVNKVIRHGRSYVWSEFWHAFRINFRQSTIVWVILFFAAAVLGVDAYIMYRIAVSGEKVGILYIAFGILFLFEMMWGNYMLPYIARFKNTTKEVFKNTLLIAVGNLIWTLFMLAWTIISGLVVFLFPIVLLFFPALYMLLLNLIMEKIFRKYMSEEELAAEEERNRKFYN